MNFTTIYCIILQGCSDCLPEEFQCKNKKCINAQWICDFTDDCGDSSDESEELCKHSKKATNGVTVPSACTDGFRCKSGSCINMSLVCNGVDDCYDGSDEKGACEISCQHRNNPCEHICIGTPTGPICRCNKGYKLKGDGHRCEDINECSMDPPMCSQLCTEVPGSFYCNCYTGYALR